VGRAFRVPNFYELYYSDAPTGFKDNQTLSPETITTWEIAVEQHLSDRLHASASLYTYSMKDLIDQTIDPADSMQHFQNQSTTTARGVEVEIDYRPGQTLHCYAMASAQLAENGETHTVLTNSPAWLARAGLSYTVRSWLEASFEGSFDSKRLTVYATETPAFALAHAKITFEPVKDRLKLSLGVRNLFNTEYFVPGGYEHLQQMLPQPGRNIIVKAACSF
jgi:iron complex outermembrane receptor protein